MTLANPAVTSHSAQKTSELSSGAFYRLVWKWHFLASLFVLPFMIMLSITGGIYLYKPQIDAWLYADRLTVEVPQNAQALTLEEQVAAVREEAGITRLRGITVTEDLSRTTVIEFNNADKVRGFAWVNPYTGEVLATQAREDMAMHRLKKFHGELLLGTWGTRTVELAAHWAIVMFVTGLVLWWPRKKANGKSRRPCIPP